MSFTPHDANTSDFVHPLPSTARPYLALMVAGVAALCAWLAFRPFAVDITGIISARVGLFAHHWNDLGFLEVRGQPFLSPITGIPISKAVYNHHPPLFYWLTWMTSQVFGDSPAALRLLPSLGAVALVATTLRVALQKIDPVIVCAAALPALASSLFVNHAAIVHAESLIAWAYVFTALCSERRRWKLAATIVFFGCWLDWHMTFAVPMLFAQEWLKPANERAWRGVMKSAVSGGVAIVLILILLHTAWNDGVDLVKTFAAAAESGIGATTSWAGWGKMAWETVQTLLSSTVAWAFAGTACWVIPLAFKVQWEKNNALDGESQEHSALKSRALLRLTLILFVPAILHVLVFRGRSFNHQCWWLNFLAPMILVFGMVGQVFALARLRWLAVALFVGMSVAAGRIALEESSRLIREGDSLAAFAQLLEDECGSDAVIYVNDFTPIAAGIDRPAIDFIDHDWVLPSVASGALPVKEFVFLKEDVSLAAQQGKAPQVPGFEGRLVSQGRWFALIYRRK